MAPRKKTEAERFWRYVDKTDTCWLWTGWLGPNGYGHFTLSDRRGIGAHRWAYLDAGGVIPEKWHVDHLCRIHECVRPSHLEAVTCKENHRRGIEAGYGPGMRERATTQCTFGHPYDDENTYVTSQGRRQCRACWPRKNAIQRARVKGKVAV